MSNAIMTAVTITLSSSTHQTHQASGAPTEPREKHRPMVEEVVTAHGGHFPERESFNSTALFSSPIQALAAARTIFQRTEAEFRSRCRIVLITGSVWLSEPEISPAIALAEDVHRATQAGDLWFGHRLRVHVEDKGLHWQSVGSFSLEYLDGVQTASVYRVVQKGRMWLPPTITRAAREDTLIRLSPGKHPRNIPPTTMVLLEGYTPGTAALRQAVKSLRDHPPSRITLVTTTMSIDKRLVWLAAGHGLVIGTANALDSAIDEACRPAVMKAVVAGLALPPVPLSKVIVSYIFCLTPDGHWGTTSTAALLRVEVKATGISLIAKSAGVSVNDQEVGVGESVALSGDMSIRCAAGDFRFLAVEGAEQTVPGCAAIVLHDTDQHQEILSNQTIKLGLRPKYPGLAVPERPGQWGIGWGQDYRAARARANGITVTSVVTSPEAHASILLRTHSATVRGKSVSRDTYVLKDGERTLHPLSGKSNESLAVKPGDLIVVGTSVVALRAPDA